MTNHSSIFAKHRPGWTLIALLIVVAIIALLMIIYLPSVLRSYSPPTTTDEQGNTVPVLEHVKDQLAPIDTHNQQLEDYLQQPAAPENSESQAE